MHDPLFRLFAAAAVVLSMLLGVLGAKTAIRRAKFGSPSTPEDAKALKVKTGGEGDHPEVARAVRAHRNALETVPVFYALGLLLVLVGGNVTAGAICFGGFVVARVLHAIFYYRAIQPARSMIFLAGQACLVGIAVQIVRAIV